MPKSTITWEADLRRQIKNEYGKGWSVTGQSSKTKLTRRHSDGTRSSVMLDVPFSNGHARDLLIAIGTHVQRINEQGISLHESMRRTVTDSHTPEGRFDWAAAAEAYKASRKDLSVGTQRATATRLIKLLATLNSRPVPKDGRELLTAYERQHLHHLKSGSEGRRKSIQETAKFLAYCIEHRGLDPQWSAPVGETRHQLVGAADGREAQLTPPLKADQLEGLLDSLEAAGRPDLRLAVGLVGLYGLRPAELATLEMENGQLWVGQVKRNAVDMRRSAKDQAKRKRRLVLPLDIPGREGLGAQLAAQWASGLVKLPLQITTAIRGVSDGRLPFKAVGDAFRQMLDRFYPWRHLVESTPGLTPYSLRHGWAWRAHKGYDRPLAVRDAAALMGHSPETHHKHYGSWTDEQGLLEAVAKLTQPAGAGVATRSV